MIRQITILALCFIALPGYAQVFSKCTREDGTHFYHQGPAKSGEVCENLYKKSQVNPAPPAAQEKPVPLEPALAGWVYLPVGTKDMPDTFMHLASLKRVNANERKGWFIFTGNKVIQLNFAYQYRSMKSSYHFDCKNRRFGMQQEIFYSDAYGKGDAVTSNKNNILNLEEVIPDSFGDLLLTAVCAYPLEPG